MTGVSKSEPYETRRFELYDFWLIYALFLEIYDVSCFFVFDFTDAVFLVADLADFPWDLDLLLEATVGLLILAFLLLIF